MCLEGQLKREDEGYNDKIMMTICKSIRVRVVIHLDVHTYYFIPCNISNDYNYTFGFAQTRARRYLRRLSESMLWARERALMHGNDHVFIIAGYNFV